LFDWTRGKRDSVSFTFNKLSVIFLIIPFPPFFLPFNPFCLARSKRSRLKEETTRELCGGAKMWAGFFFFSLFGEQRGQDEID
jgi:hypothetical protein